MYNDILTEARLSRYKLSDNDDNSEIINRYLWNIRLSEAFYPAISLFEVTLRNRIDISIKKNINKAWVYENNNLLLNIDRESILTAKQKLISKKKKCSESQIITELTLGFWVGLFKKAYKPSIWNKPNTFSDVFPYFEQKKTDRVAIIYPKLKNILVLRNRISHHEPIFDNPNGLNNCFNDLVQLIYWISPETKDLLAKIDRFQEVWEEGLLLKK